MDRPVTPPDTGAAGDLTSALYRVTAGDRDGLKTLYRSTSAKLFGICLRLLGNENEAEDVLQEVYVTVWQKAGQFDRTKSSPITWLATIARNRSIDRLRLKRVRTESVEAGLHVADESPLPFDIVELGQQQDRLSRCLDELDDRQSQVIRAAFLNGASYPELAAREAVPLGTLKSWVRRGLLHLRGCLER
ncbi:MAG: sigma-70 family RNA polymerase sigma factor [Sphingomicrobium sp.]